MTSSQKTIFLRFARGLAALVVASVAAFIVGDDFLGLVPDAYDQLVVLFLAPALLALEKFLRDGGAGDRRPPVGVATANGIQPVEEIEPEPDPEPRMSARKLAGLKGTDAVTKEMDGVEPKLKRPAH